MNIAVGKRIAGPLEVEKIDFKKMISDLYNKAFTGYISITVRGKNGFEDGSLFIKEGYPVGCIYNIISFEKFFYMKDAVELFFNAASAKYGYVDVFSLSKEQMELMQTFNEKIFFNEAMDMDDVLKYYGKEYKDSLVERYIGKKEMSKTKYALLKRIGLGNIGV